MRAALLSGLFLLCAAPTAQADGLCTARFAQNDPLPLEHRFAAILAGGGCRSGDLLHLVFEGASHGAAAAAARHCRFDHPVLLQAGAETHLVCVWHGAMRELRE
ncbi:hypothetical protein LPC08_06025 [Roseomonas sp. OT10]|uniref:hypothetical protein n=1 Tax=Roseomonas cutis TaxID=2897332 RepID=UPI001E38A6BB|nr:hypothetical protein [Roseomonas sp. OT10]UFN50180.1 hypothetical protein LPC08_06025 [Roseomonas sp. OT10]